MSKSMQHYISSPKAATKVDIYIFTAYFYKHFIVIFKGRLALLRQIFLQVHSEFISINTGLRQNLSN